MPMLLRQSDARRPIDFERVVLSKSGNIAVMKNTSIDKSKTALVVIDIQKGVVGRQTAPYPAGTTIARMDMRPANDIGQQRKERK